MAMQHLCGVLEQQGQPLLYNPSQPRATHSGEHALTHSLTPVHEHQTPRGQIPDPLLGVGFGVGVGVALNV